MGLFGSIHDAGVERKEYTWCFLLRITSHELFRFQRFLGKLYVACPKILCIYLLVYLFNIERVRTVKHWCQIFMKNIFEHLKCVPLNEKF